jgi:hypothetical protein
MFVFQDECGEQLLAANDWAHFWEVMAPNTGPEAMGEYLAAYVRQARCPNVSFCHKTGSVQLVSGPRRIMMGSKDMP